MKHFFEKSEQLQKALSLIKSRAPLIDIGGVAGCLKGMVYSFLASAVEKDLLIITSSDEVFSLYSQINSMKELFGCGCEVLFYPEDDSLIYRNIKPSKETSAARALVMQKLLSGGRKAVITDINAVAERIENKKEAEKQSAVIKKGMKLDIHGFAETLAAGGFERTGRIENRFEYSVRGNIIDVFSPAEEYPVRIELFDDMVESIRFFSIETNSAAKETEEAAVFTMNPGAKKEPGKASIADFFDRGNTLVVVDGADAIKREVLEKVAKISRYLKIEEASRMLFPVRHVFRKFAGFTRVKTGEITGHRRGIALASRSNPPFKRDLERFFFYITERSAQGAETVIVSDNEGETKHISDIITARLQPGEKLNIRYVNAYLPEGCFIPEIKLCVISNREIFERYKGKVLGRVRDKTLRPVRHYMELKEGDYVVHREHGIGVFDGIKNLKFEEEFSESPAAADFITLKYEGNDKLYIPVYKIGLIDKYVGSDAIPALSKLGSKVWRRTKEEIRQELREMADRLLKIYAQREVAKGVKYPSDDTEQQAFDRAFIYEETPDQERAIREVKADMQSEKAMDRLVCGDAGFGKTEVAMRAAFKAVNAGTQVLVLTATTLLARQHLSTFRERMADYPVRVEMVSRLVSGKARQKVLDDLKKGKVDVLIGTHAALSKKVQFMNAGLVVIDEEQHFGVKDKESLRKNYPSADILTLTATPIPRTLYFSLSGIRDISTINTPPPAKKPIETFIADEKLSMAKEIILREVLRRGQVFYVHNSIKTIFQMKDVLEKSLPEVKFVAAHGRMTKTQLERIMTDFLDRKYDVLITTTIIESGLDMPDVNTIIISNAERFGLSQLYQLRGRVGRRDRQAYAYLLVKDRHLLSGAAGERLRAIESYVDPGAGFAIAMRDLELRGAGSMLGVKQSGNMQRIGFELYCRMLEEAVKKLSGEAAEEEPDTKIKTDEPAYIPEQYIWDTAEKLRYYKRLFLARDRRDIEAIKRDMEDVWGKAPKEVEGILFVAGLKSIGRKLRAYEIQKKEGSIIVFWDSAEQVPLSRLGKFTQAQKEKMSLKGNRMEMRLTAFNKLIDYY